MTQAYSKVVIDCVHFFPPPFLEMEVTFMIEDEDEELTLEGFLDKKMEDVDHSQAESVYTLACSCLQDRKNQRPVSKQVGRGRANTLTCSSWHQKTVWR